MVSKREQAERTKQLVLTAAAEEFDENGYVGGSIGSIAARLDLTKGSVAYHYASKATLAAAIVGEQLSQIQEIIDDVQSRGWVGLPAVIVAIRDITVRANTDVVFRAAFRLNREHAVINAELPRPHLLWMSHLETFLQEAKERAEVSAGLDVPDAARAVIAMFLGEYQLNHELEAHGDLLAGLTATWRFLLPGFGVEATEALRDALGSEALASDIRGVAN